MRRIHVLWRRLLAQRGQLHRDGELTEELESHLHLHTADNLRAGLTPEAARREAVMKLGGLDLTKEQYRDQLSAISQVLGTA